MAAAGLEAVGFNVLGVAPPPDTGELARHAGLLESVAGGQRSLGDDGARAYRAAGGNSGAATDALAEHVAGKDGVLPRNTAHGLHVSVAASVMKVTFAGHEWAKKLLIGLAEIAGAVAVFSPQARAVIWARLRPFAQRVHQWMKIVRQAIGRHFSRLAELLRRPPSKQQIGDNLAAEQRAIAERWRRTAAEREFAKAAKAAHARISIGRATESMDSAGRQLRQVEAGVRDARSTVNADINAAYARGEIDADARAQLMANPKGLADDHLLDYDIRMKLNQHATELERIEAQLGRPTAADLHQARRHVEEGLDLASKHKLDASELKSLQQRVEELGTRRLDLADRAWAARMDIRRPDDLYNVHRL